MARNMYQDALDVQGAVNLSGVVRSLVAVIDELRKENKGSDYVNTHPVCRMFAEQISHLTGAGNPDSYHKAYLACVEHASQEGK
jgi:hypothetical protein